MTCIPNGYLFLTFSNLVGVGGWLGCTRSGHTAICTQCPAGFARMSFTLSGTNTDDTNSWRVAVAGAPAGGSQATFKWPVTPVVYRKTLV